MGTVMVIFPSLTYAECACVLVGAELLLLLYGVQLITV